MYGVIRTFFPFFYVAGFEVPLEMSVKLAGSETYSFHGISYVCYLIPKTIRVRVRSLFYKPPWGFSVIQDKATIHYQACIKNIYLQKKKYLCFPF